MKVYYMLLVVLSALAIGFASARTFTKLVKCPPGHIRVGDQCFTKGVDKLAHGLPDGKQLMPPMNTRNLKGFATTLPAV